MEEFWESRDYGGEGKAVVFTKASLGAFVYEVLRHGGRITSSYAMNTDYPRSYCQMGIALPRGRREEFERNSGFALKAVSRLVPA